MIIVIVILVLVFHVSEGGPWKGEIDLPFVRLGDPVHVRLFASHLLHKCLLNTNNKEKG